MPGRRASLSLASIAAAAIVLALGCADSARSPLSPRRAKQAPLGWFAEIKTLTVCKDTPAGTTGNFELVRTLRYPDGVSESGPATYASGECKGVVLPSGTNVEVYENLANSDANWHLASITKITDDVTTQELSGNNIGTAANPATCTVDADHGCTLVFHNEQDQFCTDLTALNYGGLLPCVYPPPCPDGSFTFSFLTQTGDLFIKYDQFPAPNDNSYGVNAVGWPNGHKFGDLTGSDHAGFQLLDANNVVRLSFNVDYLSGLPSAPSGYASLGVTGGDGKMLVGTAAGITATTSLANNLNNVNIPGLFTAHVQQFGSVNVLVNSPPTDAAHTNYVVSDPTLAGWDFHDTYFVTISAAKLATLGFDPETWTVAPNADQLHNSPAKACPVLPGGDGCNLAETKVEVKDKQVKVTIKNNGATDVFLSDLLLNWPASNGKLMQVKLDGDVVYDKKTVPGSVHLTTAEFVGDQNKRKINKGTSDVLTFVFEKKADVSLANYASTVQFGPCTLVILPK